MKDSSLAGGFTPLFSSVLGPLRRPKEEVKLRGTRHSQTRDAAPIAYHYDVSNARFEAELASDVLVLGEHRRSLAS